MLYTSRGRFAEYDVLVREMPRYLRCAFIDHEALLAGRWQAALDAADQAPAPPETPRTDGAEVIADMIAALHILSPHGGTRVRPHSRTIGSCITRRSIRLVFMVMSTAALSRAAASPRLFARRRSARSADRRAALPPSIAALTSMRAQATPITNEERRARIEKAQRLMAEQKIDALMLTRRHLARLLHQHPLGRRRAVVACVIPAKGEPFFVCPAFEEDRAREQIELGPVRRRHGRRAHLEGGREPVRAGREGLKDRGIAAGRLGVEETTKFVWSDGIAQAAPQLTVVSATPIVAGCRMIKEPHEIALMRLASQATLKVYEAVYHALQARDDPEQRVEPDRPGLPAGRLPRRGQRPGRRIHGAAPRLDPAADDPAKARSS